jgi:hypothetical protein
MILAMDAQKKQFVANGMERMRRSSTIYSIDYIPTDKARCGDPAAFFRSFQP